MDPAIVRPELYRFSDHSKVVEDGLGVVGDARGRGDLLGAEADGGGP